MTTFMCLSTNKSGSWLTYHEVLGELFLDIRSLVHVKLGLDVLVLRFFKAFPEGTRHRRDCTYLHAQRAQLCTPTHRAVA